MTILINGVSISGGGSGGLPSGGTQGAYLRYGTAAEWSAPNTVTGKTPLLAWPLGTTGVSPYAVPNTGSAGAGGNLTLTGTPTAAGVATVVGAGVDGGIVVGSSASTTLRGGAAVVPSTATWTMDAWLYWRGAGGVLPIIFGKQILGAWAAPFINALYLNTATLALSRVVGGTQELLDSGVTIQTEQWSHIAATVSGATITFYINGQLRTVVVSGLGAVTDWASTNGDWTVGNCTNDQWVNGVVGTARVWNNTLSTDEIASLYYRGISAWRGP
jgi:hypothetical protein